MYLEMGTWKFNGDKTHIILTRADGKETDYTITRLEKNDLRLKSTLESGCERKIHFLPKGDG